jgi:hypothetical protein
MITVAAIDAPTRRVRHHFAAPRLALRNGIRIRTPARRTFVDGACLGLQLRGVRARFVVARAIAPWERAAKEWAVRGDNRHVVFSAGAIGRCNEIRGCEPPDRRNAG